MTAIKYSIADLQRVMQRLRDPEHGCPWDLAQDFKSIVPSTLEECYELAHAIEHEDYPHVAEELGDVMFQVIFYSQLGREQNVFSFEEVVNTLVEKLLRRHPHVFFNGEIEGVVGSGSTVEQVRQSWESIKQTERVGRAQSGALDDVPVALPALPRAQKLQKRAAGVGFDWSSAGGVLAKLEEEIFELRQAIVSQAQDEINAEMGDVLFTAVNLARHLGLDAEGSLRASSSKFERRFRLMEAQAATAGQSLESLSAPELEALWQGVKNELA